MTAVKTRGGSCPVLLLKKRAGGMSAEDREHECWSAIAAILEYYRCEMAADIPEDSRLWVEAKTDERLN